MVPAGSMVTVSHLPAMHLLIPRIPGVMDVYACEYSYCQFSERGFSLLGDGVLGMQSLLRICDSCRFTSR